jgi:hypothetical protein
MLNILKAKLLRNRTALTILSTYGYLQFRFRERKQTSKK